MKINTGNWVRACEVLVTFHSERGMSTQAGGCYLGALMIVENITGLTRDKVQESIDLVMANKPRESLGEKARLIAASIQQKASMR